MYVSTWSLLIRSCSKVHEKMTFLVTSHRHYTEYGGGGSEGTDLQQCTTLTVNPLPSVSTYVTVHDSIYEGDVSLTKERL